MLLAYPTTDRFGLVAAPTAPTASILLNPFGWFGGHHRRKLLCRKGLENFPRIFGPTFGGRISRDVNPYGVRTYDDWRFWVARQGSG
jgi:hypothetical protein